ncbi:hypothetical protein [Kineococcus rhizosphaerae]|uniref:hypothetical protein n=1 Tax=Kineococcus rhizosphaerae TaxID=559628 RepID=UPI001472A047|nr:hypothetical protein [Kineococcus rhizosphaerae]
MASRCSAAGGALAAVLHVPLAVAHAGASLPLALLLLVMSLVCLPCAGHLWRDPGRRTWRLAALVGSAVLVLHAALLLAPAGSGVRLDLAGHAGHATDLGAGGSSPLAAALVPALTLAQVVTALVLLGRARHRSCGDGTPVVAVEPWRA